jgi:pimeloyl-ACP methyl ester carboxylesterase
MAGVEWSQLRIHGQPVGYAEAGAGPAGGSAKPPVVVLVHGIASRASQWEAVMERLSETCHVIAPDLLGHGSSAKPRGDYSLGAHACGIRDLTAALGHDRVSLVGHSLGGGIAMQFAYQFPERVERLALISSGGLGREVSIFLRAATLPGAELMLPLLTGSWVRQMGRGAHGLLRRLRLPVPAGLVECFAGFGSLADRESREAFVHTARSVLDPAGQRVDARDRLYLAADLPLFVVWGRKDGIIPIAHGESLVATVPGTRLEVFEQSGHFLYLTEPVRLGEVLADWVRRTPAVQVDPAALTSRLRQPADRASGAGG